MRSAPMTDGVILEPQAERVGADELPPEVEAMLRKARNLHRAAMAARIGSNRRRKKLAAFQEVVVDLSYEAAARGVPLAALPEWARDY